MPPEAGRANRALAELLASALGVAPRDIEIVSGAANRVKTIRVRGLSEEELRARVAAAG